MIESHLTTAKIKADAKVEKLRAKLRAAEIDQAAATLAWREADKPRIPSEPARDWDRPAVITFTKKFGGNNVYQYAAIRAAGMTQWVPTTASSTSTAGKYYTWAQLMTFIADKETDQGRAALASIRQWINSGALS